MGTPDLPRCDMPSSPDPMPRDPMPRDPVPRDPVPREPHSVFVYGTLKRGEVRETSWPCKPVKIVASRIRAALFDLGPYPAIVPGSDWVQGERWQFAGDRDLQRTLRALDEIEGYARDPANDLYERVIATCHDLDGSTWDAYTYLFARPEQLPHAQRMRPSADGICAWHAAADQRYLA